MGDIFAQPIQHIARRPLQSSGRVRPTDGLRCGGLVSSFATYHESMRIPCSQVSTRCCIAVERSRDQDFHSCPVLPSVVARLLSMALYKLIREVSAAFGESPPLKLSITYRRIAPSEEDGASRMFPCRSWRPCREQRAKDINQGPRGPEGSRASATPWVGLSTWHHFDVLGYSVRLAKLL